MVGLHSCSTRHPLRHARLTPRSAVTALAVIVVLASVGASASVAKANDAPAPIPGLTNLLVPAKSGALVGIVAGPRNGRTRQQEILYDEAEIQRRFDIDHLYYFWDQPFPNAYDTWTASFGRIPFISWVPQRLDRTWIPWNQVARGWHDGAIRAKAKAIRAFRSPVMLTFHHEPDTAGWAPADYVAAWRRMVWIFRQEQATNVVWVWNLTAYTFLPGGADPAWYYPGNDVVDWIAADGYNWFGSSFNPGPWRSFHEIFKHFYAWGKARNKPLMIAETGVLEDGITPDPMRKARWIEAAAATMKSWPAIRAFIYFNQFGWWFESSLNSTLAFRGLTNDPYFNPRGRTLGT